MKKTLLGLAVFAMTLMPSVAFAQSQTEESGVKVENTINGKEAKSKKDKKNKENKKRDGKRSDFQKSGKCEKGQKCDKAKKCDKAQKCDKAKKGGKDFGARKDGRKMMKGDKRAYNDSVNLASLNLNDSQLARVKVLNEARKTSARELREQARVARQNGDTTFVFDGSQVEMLQSKYLKDLREVLTADQYVQFLENNYVKAASSQKHLGSKVKAGKKDGKFRGEAGKRIRPAKENITASK